MTEVHINQSIDYWFVYDRDLFYERVELIFFKDLERTQNVIMWHITFVVSILLYC